MPILEREPDIYPPDLFEDASLARDPKRTWYSVYTLSRREKDLMRRLFQYQVRFYGPVIGKRYRSPSGRLRTSHIPLFANYVFMLANHEERDEAMRSNCISRCEKVKEVDELIEDLARIRAACLSGIPLTPEAKLQSGDQVRVRTGPFAGYDGLVIRREGRTRLLLSVRFLEQGVSMELDEGHLEAII